VRRFNDPREGEFSPPPEQVPLSLDPRDHFYFRRPVDASANSSSIFWYVYGSDGPQNAWRVHHGIDLPNPVGKEVRAAAAGRVIWAADNYVWFEEGRRIESAYTYGNVVIIQHDFGFQGKRLYTLYAHLNVILVTAGQRVQSGEIIGLSGRSGVVSGPHVHFEVRVGRNNYYETRNPLLWMAPYANTGVVAGRVVYPNGQFVNDVTVRLVNAAGRTVDTTTTYVNPRVPGLSNWNVNPDEVWNENFVFGDVPPGEYTIVVSVNGIVQRRSVTVRPATTTFVDFGASEMPLEPTPAG
jgi:murein DD-endopeptidase MepM/ murein hydrolase activator NlpD